MHVTSKLVLAFTAQNMEAGNEVHFPEEIPLWDPCGLLRKDQANEPINRRSASFWTDKAKADFQSLHHRLVARRAYERWEANGRPSGTALRDWLEAEAEVARSAGDVWVAACPYQVKGRLLTGEEAVICTKSEGSCPQQVMRPSTGGRHQAICTLPSGF